MRRLAVVAALLFVGGCHPLVKDPKAGPPAHRAESPQRKLSANRPKGYQEDHHALSSDRTGIAAHRATTPENRDTPPRKEVEVLDDATARCNKTPLVKACPTARPYWVAEKLSATHVVLTARVSRAEAVQMTREIYCGVPDQKLVGCAPYENGVQSRVLFKAGKMKLVMDASKVNLLKRLKRFTP